MDRGLPALLRDRYGVGNFPLSRLPVRRTSPLSCAGGAGARFPCPCGPVFDHVARPVDTRPSQGDLWQGRPLLRGSVPPDRLGVPMTPYVPTRIAIPADHNKGNTLISLGFLPLYSDSPSSISAEFFAIFEFLELLTILHHHKIMDFGLVHVQAVADTARQGNPMSKSDVFENDLLKAIFNATPIAGLLDNAASGPVTNLYFALHTADPGDAGTQTTNEVTYTGYARVAVARTGVGFIVSANSVSPAANVDFPVGTGGGGTATHFSVGTDAAGAGRILYKGALSQNIPLGSGVIPRLTPATVITED